VLKRLFPGKSEKVGKTAAIVGELTSKINELVDHAESCDAEIMDIEEQMDALNHKRYSLNEESGHARRVADKIAALLS